MGFVLALAPPVEPPASSTRVAQLAHLVHMAHPAKTLVTVLPGELAQRAETEQGLAPVSLTSGLEQGAKYHVETRPRLVASTARVVRPMAFADVYQGILEYLVIEPVQGPQQGWYVRPPQEPVVTAQMEQERVPAQVRMLALFVKSPVSVMIRYLGGVSG